MCKEYNLPHEALVVAVFEVPRQHFRRELLHLSDHDSVPFLRLDGWSHEMARISSGYVSPEPRLQLARGGGGGRPSTSINTTIPIPHPQHIHKLSSSIVNIPYALDQDPNCRALLSDQTEHWTSSTPNRFSFLRCEYCSHTTINSRVLENPNSTGGLY